ncbi:putative uncharacterized protein [Firmicutes bacterium CAG:646]|nr:putative uncharacterized protein [Firmicutes bacterium CAG:646]
MSKMTDYQAGREDGLLLAERIVKEGGLERLQEEIKYRGITGVHTQLAKKEIEKASEVIKMTTIDTILLLASSTVRDEFGFGEKRMQRLINRMEKKATCLIGDMATWEDFRETIKEEMGIEVNVRQSAGRISFTK